MLIKQGADPSGDDEGDDGIPLTHFFTQYSKIEPLRAVLESVAINIPNNAGRTAMFFAHSPDIVRLLFHAGHSVDWQDTMGFTPLHGMMSRKDPFRMVKALLDANCNPNAADMNGSTPLHIMCLKFHEKLLYQEFNLYDHEAICDYRSDRRVQLRKRLDTIKLLVNYGASFTTKDNEGKSPFDFFRIPIEESCFPEWKEIEDFITEVHDAQSNNHCFKRARTFEGEEGAGEC
jgi:ankyrin repeat protein